MFSPQKLARSYILISLIVSLYNVHIRLKHHVAPLRQFLNSLIDWLCECMWVSDKVCACEHIWNPEKDVDPSELEVQMFMGCSACYVGAGFQTVVLVIVHQVLLYRVVFSALPMDNCHLPVKINDWKQIEWIKFLPAYVLEISLPNL